MNRGMTIAAGLVLLATMCNPAFSEEDDRAQGEEVTLIPAPEAWDRSTEDVAVAAGAGAVDTAFSVAASQNLVGEVEPNDTSASATPLGGTNVVRIGYISPNADVDYWSFTASVGSRVYVATMTAATATGASNDTIIDLIASDGVTVLESDDQDGFFSGSASSIAGTVIPSTGTYFIRVRGFAVSNQIRPYHLHFRLQTGAAALEVEPNDTIPTAQPSPPATRIAGLVASAADPDFYSFALNAGDTVYLALDADPERDAIDTTVRLGVGLFGDGAGSMVVFDDPGGAGPDSEAVFMTVKSAGTYYASVTATAAGSYELSVSVLPATPQGTNCTTYTSIDVPKAISDLGTTTSTITVPGHPRIADLDVSIQLNHSLMTDIDAHLRSPQGNDNGLFTDIGNSMQTQMDLIVDDEAAIPFGFAATARGVVFQPEPSYRLSWFDGEDAGGVWALDLRDDLGTNLGTLTGWSLTICEPLPICAGTPVTLYQSDFESGAGGFTHAGTADEWERGLPAFAPITSCHSGVSCWKTDLDNTYNATSSQDLTSPTISLSGVSGPITASWAQRYQMESASFDHAFVEVHEVPSANPRRLFEWLDATMTDAVGNPPATINASAGWGPDEREHQRLRG